MKTPALIGIVAGLIALGVVRVSPARAEEGKALSQALQVTGAAIGDLAGKISTTEKGMLVLEIDLPSDEKPKPPTPEIAQAHEELTWVKQMARQAEQELEAAKSAPNPAAAQVMIRDAQLKAETARGLLTRIADGLHPAAVKGGQPESGRRPMIHLASEGEALRQLKAANRLAEKGYGTGAVYEGSTPEIAYDPLKQQIRTRDGKTIDVRPLSKMFRGNAPLFRQVTVPGNPTPITQLNPEAKAAFEKPEARKVGGVDLQVTLDLLGFMGIADFRHQGPAAHIDAPVLISLAGLCARAKTYAADWEKLPEALRYPGSIGRVHGFVLDRKHQDVFLVGSRARRPENRMDIDSLIIAFQTVWLRGLTPAVSLDPLPDNPGGPQYSRVINLPQDSLFAKIMLDADYAMKRIAFGALTVAEPGFESLAQLSEREVRAGILPKDSSFRMWLYPVPISRGNIHVSPSGRTALFETRVMLLTENGHITSNGFAGTGSTDEEPERVAKSFTAAYGDFENSNEIEPRGVYVRLHGLVDLVTTGKFLREAMIDYPVLRELCRLPIRQLRGAASVPAYYPGINVPVSWGTITGGVMARPRLANRMLDRYQDATTAGLEYAVEQFRRSGSFAQPVSLDFTLPQSGFESQWEVERLISAGEAALSKARYGDAREKFLAATRLDPSDSDAWAFLGQAESFLGQHREAQASIARATRLEPGDPTFRMIALDVALRANPGLDLSTQDEGVRRQLSEEYSERARAALSGKQPAAARKYADLAIRLWDDATDAYFIRAFTWKDGDRQASSDWIEAIRGYRRLMRGDNPEQWQRRLALALAARAGIRLRGMDREQGTTTEYLDELQRAEDEARESHDLDPSLPLGLVTEIIVRATRAGLYKQMGLEPDLAPLRQLADQAVRQFPDFSPAHDWRGMALSLSGEQAGAIREFAEALRLDPTSKVALSGRALLYAEQKMCSEALADATRLRALGGGDDAELTAALGRCRQ